MGRIAILVTGPAGVGKTTFCQTLRERCEVGRRTIHIMNLDPASESNQPWSIDIKELITLQDAMEEMELGPNGGLMFCMEFLMQNMDWFTEAVGEFDDDYLLIDCPGQIELYSHSPVMKSFTKELQRLGYTVCSIYLIDAQFICEPSKFVAGILSSLSAMVLLETTHINVLSKCDLVGIDAPADEDDLRNSRYLLPEAADIAADMPNSSNVKYRRLNQAIAQVIDDFSLVSFVPLNIKSDDSIEFLLNHIDLATGYGEDQDFRDPQDAIDSVEENLDFEAGSQEFFG